MKRVLLTISYNGTNYAGWQVQNNANTIQAELEKALEKVFQTNIKTFVSGRTDAGVHAINQKVHFDIEKTIDIKKLSDALNSYLPQDITVKHAKYVRSDFNARFDVKEKTYLYKIYQSKTKDCFLENYALQVPKKLDVNQMKIASSFLIGKHNFKAFCSANTNSKDFEKEIFSIKISVVKNIINIKISGSGFLYNMVRIIVGTLIEVGEGKREPKDVKDILESQNREKAGKTVKPFGLYLFKVKY